MTEWGMAIDVDRCTGCEACVVACRGENNVPVAGPVESSRGRTTEWLRIERFMDRVESVSGIPLQVVELTGEAGDVVLGHPWLLHATAPNCGTRTRMMCVQRIHLENPS